MPQGLFVTLALLQAEGQLEGWADPERTQKQAKEGLGKRSSKRSYAKKNMKTKKPLRNQHENRDEKPAHPKANWVASMFLFGIMMCYR